jgi:hypothetical protein
MRRSLLDAALDGHTLSIVSNIDFDVLFLEPRQLCFDDVCITIFYKVDRWSNSPLTEEWMIEWAASLPQAEWGHMCPERVFEHSE